MFVQILEAKVKDEAGLRKQSERWIEDVRPGAVGFLGSTGGITKDGTFIIAARFESEEAAQRNSDRPEQSKWWAETADYLENPSFTDCTDVTEWGAGGSDDAGFVQIMRGRATDYERLVEVSKNFDSEAGNTRPDVIGGYHAHHGDGSFTDVVYFTSEAEARKGESQEMPPEIAETMKEWQSLMQDMRYYDLSEPQFVS